MDEEEEEQEEAGAEHTHLREMASILGEELCVLCHQAQSPNGSSTLGFVCQVTRSVCSC